MRHRTILSLALILGLVPALNAAPLLALQEQVQPPQVVPCDPDKPEVLVGEQRFVQDCTSDFYFGLEVTERPEKTETPIDEAPYRFYDFRFHGEPGYEIGAYIPERFNSEAMVVSVLTGSFAFRVQSPGIIVDPNEDEPLERYTATVSLGLGENPTDRATGREFKEEGEHFNCDLILPDGRRVCLLDAQDVTEFKKETIFVRLDQGDIVYLPSNSTCFLCNTERIDSTTPAELQIWSSTTGFNGNLENLPEANSQATPTVQGSGRIVGWMFNPGSRCH